MIRTQYLLHEKLGLVEMFRLICQQILRQPGWLFEGWITTSLMDLMVGKFIVGSISWRTDFTERL